MNKRGKKLVVVIAVLIQMILGILYGFSNIPVSSGMCFLIWCACTMMICRFIEVPEMI